MLLVYVVPNSVFLIEAVLMLLVGGIVGTDFVSGQFAVNLRCACWTMAAVSVISVIYICRVMRRKLQSNSDIDKDDLQGGVIGIHMMGGTLGFAALSLLLGGASGGVVFEVLWFIKVVFYAIATVLASLLFCAIALPLTVYLCRRFWNRKSS